MVRNDKTTRTGKLFFRYVVPSTISMLTAGVYTLVDGFFVGWGAGDTGLAAINVAFPLSLLIVACGEMIGTGGAVAIALARGRGNLRVADRLFGNMLILLVPAVLLLVLLLPLLDPILIAAGAAPELLPATRIYVQITMGGGFFMMATVCLVAAMRNDGAPRLAMGIMVAGLIANILLDYLFVLVFRGGVAGSAWATILAQMICFLLALCYFGSERTHFRIRRTMFRLQPKLVHRIVTAGIPSFGVQISVAAVIFLHNRQTLLYGGVAAVAAYAIISYVESTILMLQQGIGTGIQPLISYLQGAGETRQRNSIAHRGLFAAVLIGVGGAVLSAGGSRIIPDLFNAGTETLHFAERGLLISALVYPFLGIQKVSESYFQAIGRPGTASLLVYLDCFVVLPISLLLLPHLFGTDGIWAAMPVSKLFMAAVVLLLQLLYKREEEYRKNPAVRQLRFNSALLLPSSGDIVKKATNT